MQPLRHAGRFLHCSPSPLLCEPLEPRTLLAVSPLPSLDLLEDPANPVLRITTVLGVIDVELFHHQVPALVDQLLRNFSNETYPTLTCDQWFFHRSTPGVALQGGLLSWLGEAASGLAWANAVCFFVEDAVGVARPNTARTVATGIYRDPALLGVTNFIFNLADNSERFAPEDIVVYGQVIGEDSWSVVIALSELPTADLSQSPIGTIFGGSMLNTPILGEYTQGDDVPPELLAQSYDLALIKATGAGDFFRHTLYAPEGFTGATISEFVPIANPNGEPVHYELIARYESVPGRDLARDRVVAAGVIGPNSRGGVTISTPQTWASGRLVHGRPYALELRSTLPLAASLSRYDFGSGTGEPFVSTLTTSWFFADVQHADATRDFLVWLNPGEEPATITVTFFTEEGAAPASVTIITPRYRRGGLALASLPELADGRYAVVIESSVPIVAALSHYSVSTAWPIPVEGYTTIGQAGAASAVGVVPIAIIASSPFTPATEISFYNPGEADAVISIDLFLPGDAEPVLTLPAELVVPAGRRATLELPRTLDIPAGAAVSAVYTSTSPVFASYSMRRLEDRYGSPVAVEAAETFHFAEGFTDPARTAPSVLEEHVVLFNPWSARFGAPERAAQVRFTFRYAEGHTFFIDRAVAPGTSAHIAVSSLEQIIAEASEHGRFFYSIEVSSDVPIIAQMLHTDARIGGASTGGFAALGLPAGALVRLDGLG